jgi:hypothetical protein
LTLQDKLFIENSKSYWIQLSKEVLNENQMEELVGLFLGKDKRMAQRAAAIVMTLADIESELFAPYMHILIKQLRHNPTETQKRNIVRIVDFVEIPTTLEVEIMNFCFQYLENPKESIAVRAFSMRVLGKLHSKYPEIKEELKTLVEMNLDHNPSPGIINCGNKILKSLKNKIL